MSVDCLQPENKADKMAELVEESIKERRIEIVVSSVSPLS